MIKAFRAETLDDALAKLKELIASSGDAEKNLIFSEDRITLLAERALLGAGGGTFDTEITTFARYLSGRGGKRLSKEGSVMKISELILKRKEEGGCFHSGSARAVYETIAQLAASSVTPEMLKNAAPETDGMLGRKLLDLAAVYGEYEAFLKESGMTDENGYLALLPEKIASDGLGNTNVYFFAFPSFTRQALEGAEACFAHAKNVTGIFLGGSAGIYTNRAYRRFVQAAEGSAETGEIPSSLAGEARVLRDCLFTPSAKKAQRAQHIHAFEARDEADEAKTVAALIKKKIAEGKRYRDMIVLVSGEEYFLPVEKAFKAYKIPFYAEKTRKLSTHPFALYALGILEAVRDNVTPDEADAIAGSVCFGEADEYRNYLLRYGGYRGAVKREIRADGNENDIEKLKACREKMLRVLALFPRSGKGKEYTEAVRKLFALTDWDRVMKTLQTAAGEALTEAEKTFLMLDLNEGSLLKSVLDEIDAVAGERKFGVREFSALLSNGLDAAGVSMIPPQLDAVYVGDVTESRFTRSDCVFVLGLTDAVPRTGQDTAVITDGEISRLSEIEVNVEPAIAEVNARARESFALNLTGFSGDLFLSRPMRLNGKETEKSEALRDAEKAFRLAPLPDLFPYLYCEAEPAALALAEANGEGHARNAELANALTSVLAARRDGGTPDFKVGEKEAPNAGDLWLRGGKIAPTTLESYFLCPYLGFASRGLRLKEREEGVRAADTGMFIHAVLERMADKFNETEDGEAFRTSAKEEAERLASEPQYSALGDSAAGKYAEARLIEEGCAVAEAAWTQLKRSRFSVSKAEENVTVAGLNIAGKADRVDSSDNFVRVIDYKTGRIDDSPTSYYTGRKLQLELYLLAALNGKEPAGAFYFPAADKFGDDGDAKFRMKGYYNKDDEALSRLDPGFTGNGKSELIESGSTKGMSGEDFRRFLGYAELVAGQAQEEMRAGNIRPNPYEGACEHCKLHSLCAFTGDERKERAVTGADIVKITEEADGGKE